MNGYKLLKLNLSMAQRILEICWQKGVDIYYISDRDKEKDLKATQKNLKQQGIPQAKKSHILLKVKMIRVKNHADK